MNILIKIVSSESAGVRNLLHFETSKKIFYTFRNRRGTKAAIGELVMLSNRNVSASKRFSTLDIFRFRQLDSN